MHLGVTGMIPGDFNLIDERLVRKIAELGFTGVGAHLGGDPQAMSPALCQRIRSIFEQQGIRLVQFWGQRYPSIISPDETVRQAGVHMVQDLIRLGADLDAQMLGVRPTSLNPRGDWWPDPANYEATTEDRLVRSLREISSACEAHGLPIALECHVTTTLDSPESIRRIIERTESSWIKVTMDPFNFVADLRTAYNTTALVNHLFDILSPYIAAAHVKDVYVEDRHVVHISETIPGDGIFDLDTFFRRFEALLPDGFALIEHLPEAQIPQAMAFVTQKLKALNIPIVS
jgi:sugar phosphate isomerase/epimerase